MSSPALIGHNTHITYCRISVSSNNMNSRSVVNKSAVINNHILENKIGNLCIIETWINDGEFSNSLLSSFIPSNYVLSQYYGRPHPFRGGGVRSYY